MGMMAKRSLIFNKNTIQKLKNSYSAIKEITILSANVGTNTFNTFWNSVERNSCHKDKLYNDKVAKHEYKLNENSENNNNSLDSSFEDNEEDLPKVLEDEKQTNDN
jgi:hypothetical protein